MSVDAKTSAEVAPKPDEVTLTIDGMTVSVPKGSLVIRAAEKLGVDIPRFCDHPLLDPMGACRQCMVDIPDMGNGRGAPGGKPQAACVTEAMPNMVVNTQATSPKAKKAQEGILELLLINHPLDCPICDKGGECPLQNQAMSNGPSESRFGGYAKRTFPKPVNVSQQILLDRERCVLCARCTRFSEQISGDPFIALVERGALQQVGFYEEKPYNSYYSGNVAQICPVGALTSADYRFQARPFDLVSTPTACEHCASGCALRTDHRHFQVKRRLAGVDMDVNEEWNCDKGRFGFMSARGTDRLTTPLVRENGELRPASWPEAIDVAVRGLAAAGHQSGVLTGGRLSMENAYAYAKFARTVLGTNNIDFRTRPHTDEETDFLAAHVAGKTVGQGVTYADVQAAHTVVLVGFEPEEESPIVFLRLKKAVRKNKTQVFAVAPFLSRGTSKLGATLIPTVPGREASALKSSEITFDANTVIMVGERASHAAGTLSAVAEIAARTGAKLAWIPRRAGDRGAIETGCVPTLLPGGRRVADASARVDLQAAWGVGSLSATAGMSTEAMLGAVRDGELKALVIAGVELRDFRDASEARTCLDKAEFVISIETRRSDITELADVVFPVALMEEQSGSFLNWEHRRREFQTAIKVNNAPMTDLRTLAALADALDKPLGIRSTAQAAKELAEIGPWEGERTHMIPVAAPAATDAGLLLATWRLLIDEGRGTQGATALLATARPATLRVSPATAAAHHLGAVASVSTEYGTVTLPVEITEDMVDNVVWLATNSAGSVLSETLRVTSGDVVRLKAAQEGGAA